MIQSNTKYVTQFKLEVIECLYVITSYLNLPQKTCACTCDIHKSKNQQTYLDKMKLRHNFLFLTVTVLVLISKHCY